jgi:hypothetical protein
MKTLALSLALLALLSPRLVAAEDDTKSFGEHFYDEANIPAYVAAVDELIAAGEARIYASMDDERKDPKSPSAKTPNGIFMIYTVTHTPDGVLVHFSMSRPPYLATPLGKHMVGLFMFRAGWPKPMIFNISERRVFHAFWNIPEAQFAQIQAALPELRAKIKASADAKTAFMRGLLRAGDLQEAPIPTPPSSPGPGSRGAP